MGLDETAKYARSSPSAAVRVTLQSVLCDALYIPSLFRRVSEPPASDSVVPEAPKGARLNGLLRSSFFSKSSSWPRTSAMYDYVCLLTFPSSCQRLKPRPSNFEGEEPHTSIAKRGGKTAWR